MAKVSIIVPVFNEVNTVRQLLDLVWTAPVPTDAKEVVIVESNSVDGTRQVVADFVKEKEVCQNPTVKVIFEEKPQGKGHAVREAFKAATGDIILIQDGDLEYSVEDYPQLIEPILSGKTKFVLGSRHLAAGSWKIRNFETSPLKAWVLNLGGIFFHGLFNLLYGQTLTDPTTMYKVFEKKCLDGIVFESNRFEFDYELLGKLIRAGFTPLEVPVSYSSRSFEEGKKIRVLTDPFRWVWAIVKFRFTSLEA